MFYYKTIIFLQNPILNFEEAQKICKTQVVHHCGFACIELVAGAAGKPIWD